LEPAQSSRFPSNRPTAIIAEDEPLLRRELKQALASLWPELAIVAEAEDGSQALQALDKHAPQLMFLDIAMPRMSGLEVARAAGRRCHVVFVTAYDQYAVSAFERGAIDYVMKPFELPRLAAAIDRVRERLAGVPANLEGLLASLIERSVAKKRFLRWITVAHGRSVRLIPVNDICYFQADNKYTLVVTPHRAVAHQQDDQGTARRARPRYVPAGAPRHDRQRERDLGGAPRPARASRGAVEAARRSAAGQRDVRASVPPDVAGAPVPDAGGTPLVSRFVQGRWRRFESDALPSRPAGASPLAFPHSSGVG
jgi:DNA-binding LytR/AlgR family response regulator